MISIIARKRVCWFLLLLGLGGVILLIIAIIQAQAGSPPMRIHPAFYAWGAVSAGLAAASAVFLRRCYRAEPARRVGYWHLTLTDFFVSTFFSAMCMALWKGLWPDSFVFQGAALSVLAGVALILSLLAAEWRGYTRYAVKLPLAFAILLKTYGKVILAGLLALSLFACVVTNPFEGITLLFEVLFNSVSSSETWLQDSARLAAVALPIGWLTCRVIERHVAPDHAQPQPKPSESTTPPDQSNPALP